jgi:hypothetical protein
VQCLTPARETGAARQGKVQIEAFASAGTQFVQIPQEERVLGMRVAMDAGEEDIGAVIEDGLGAVAVVVVDVQDGDARQALVAQRLRRQRRVVQEAVTAEEVGPGMVAGRAAERKGGRGTTGHRVGSIQRTERALAGGLPGASGQRRAGVEENRPRRAAKLAGNTSLRKPWLGHTEGKASRAALAGSSATHSSQACSRNPR